MHILAVTVLFFMMSIYLLSAESVLILFLFICLFIPIIAKYKRRMLTILIVAPLLAYLSLKLYYMPVVPSQVRVTAVYQGSAVVRDGFRRYEIQTGEMFLKPGDIIKAQFLIEPLPYGNNGYAGRLDMVNPSVYADVVTKLKVLKKTLIDEVLDTYGYDQGGLMASLVLGHKDDVDEKRLSDMRSMGIMHVLSISGFHFGLLEMALKKLKMGRSRVILLGAYAFFIDSIPGYRTIITLTHRTLAFYFRRDADPVTGLFFAMFIQVFLSPYVIFKTGFLLTYLSTLGIILFHEPVMKHMRELPFIMMKSFSLTFAALSLSFPLILSFSPDFSLGVFLGNMFLVPVYTIVTYLSFMGILLMKIPLLNVAILPFIEVFFTLAGHLASFMGNYVLSINLSHLIYNYVPYLIITSIFFFKRAFKRAVFITLLLLSVSLPWGSSLKIYNKFGYPYIQITKNFSNYDIMDYRVAEGGFIPLRKEQTIMVDERKIVLKPADKERQVPHIYIDGEELFLERDLKYHGGVMLVKEFIFFGERIMRVR